MRVRCGSRLPHLLAGVCSSPKPRDQSQRSSPPAEHAAKVNGGECLWPARARRAPECLDRGITILSSFFKCSEASSTRRPAGRGSWQSGSHKEAGASGSLPFVDRSHFELVGLAGGRCPPPNSPTIIARRQWCAARRRAPLTHSHAHAVPMSGTAGRRRCPSRLHWVCSCGANCRRRRRRAERGQPSQGLPVACQLRIK